MLLWGSSTKAATVSISEPEISPLPPAALTLGGRTSSHDSDGFVDVLVPLLGDPEGFVFLNPRASLGESDANEENIGAGYRRLLFDGKLIAGGNIFYDTRETAHDNRFDQLGLGLELLTEWIDFRNNWYITEDEKKLAESRDIQESQQSIRTSLSAPFFGGNEVRQIQTTRTTTTTTTRRFESFEKSMDGFDVEIGVKLPILQNIKWLETRIFGGYYHYDADFSEDIAGAMARVEVRALPYLIFDGQWFDDRELHGTNYYAGARAVIPFEAGNIIKLKNPFEGTKKKLPRQPRTLGDRMTEMVIRDLDIVTEASDFIENPKKTIVTSMTETSKKTLVLVNDITFVDASNFFGIDSIGGNNIQVDPPIGFENGTFEHPFNTVQEGIDNAFGAKRVYVNAGTYNENVVMRDGVYLHGSGNKVWGPESGVKPILNGFDIVDPAITLANNVEIDGFSITNIGVLGGPAISNGFTTMGVFGDNNTNLNIHHNAFSNSEAGIALEVDPSTAFTATIVNNTFSDHLEDAILITGDGGGTGTFSTTISNNTIANILDANNNIAVGAGNGIHFTLTDFASLNATFDSNTITSGGHGILIDTFAAATPANGGTLQITNNTITGNVDDNIELNLEARSDTVNLFITGNNLNGSVNGSSLHFHGTFSAGSDFNGQISNNSAANNTDDNNISIDLASVAGDMTLTLDNNNADNSNFDGINVSMESITGNLNLTASNNDASANGFGGIFVFMGSDEGNITAVFSGNTTDGNVECGLALEAGQTGIFGDIDVTVTNNRSVGNICDGLNLALFAADAVTVFAENNVFKSNTLDGIFLDLDSPTTTYDVNFGDAIAGTAGFNSLQSNGMFGIENASVDTFLIMAENNFWADATPDQGEEYDEGAGTIDADPALAFDPN